MTINQYVKDKLLKTGKFKIASIRKSTKFKNTYAIRLKRFNQKRIRHFRITYHKPYYQFRGKIYRNQFIPGGVPLIIIPRKHSTLLESIKEVIYYLYKGYRIEK